MRSRHGHAQQAWARMAASSSVLPGLHRAPCTHFMAGHLQLLITSFHCGFIVALFTVVRNRLPSRTHSLLIKGPRGRGAGSARERRGPFRLAAARAGQPSARMQRPAASFTTTHAELA